MSKENFPVNLSSLTPVDPRTDTDSLRGFATTPRYVRFGPFHVDCGRQQVYRAGKKLTMQGKVYQMLMVLIQKQDEVVSREQLGQALWPAGGSIDYESNVNVTVAKLRRALALGESLKESAYIETIPRRGYSFIGSAEFSDKPFPESAPTQVVAYSGDAIPSGFGYKVLASASRRRVTLMIIGLIFASILLGAGAVWLWYAHVAPQFRHWMSLTPGGRGLCQTGDLRSIGGTRCDVCDPHTCQRQPGAGYCGVANAARGEAERQASGSVQGLSLPSGQLEDSRTSSGKGKISTPESSFRELASSSRT